MTDDDVTDIRTLVLGAVAATTLDAERVIRRAEVAVRSRRRRVRLSAAGVAVLVAAGLAAGLSTTGHDEGRAQVVVVGTPTPTPTARQAPVPPPAVLEHVDLPAGWHLLNELTGPLPTPDGTRVTNRELRYVGPGGSTNATFMEVIIVLQTGDVSNAPAAQSSTDPSIRIAPITRPGASPIQLEPGAPMGGIEQYSWLERGVFVQVDGRGGVALAPIVSSLQFRPGQSAPYLVPNPKPATAGDGTTPAVPVSQPLSPQDSEVSRRREAFALGSQLTPKATRILDNDSIDVRYSNTNGDVEIDTQTLDTPLPLGAVVDLTAPHAYLTDTAGDAAAVSLSAGRLEVAVTDAYGQLVLVQGSASLLGPPDTVLRQAETYLTSAYNQPVNGLPAHATLSR